MSAATIHGECPLCKHTTQFRELSFTENLSGLGHFFSGLLLGGKNLTDAATSLADAREFPNYICHDCAGEVMQCRDCDEIIPYAHTGASHVCCVSESGYDAS